MRIKGEKMLNTNIKLIVVFLFLSNLMLAGCGKCQINNKKVATKKTSAFVSSVPSNGKIQGFVIASCNKCNLGKISDKKCSMGIRVKDKVYAVEGHSHNKKEAHNQDGICNTLRVAYVSGQIKGEKFKSSDFVLINSPN